MCRNELTLLLVSTLLTSGMSASVMAETTLTASTQNAPVSEAATLLANSLVAANGDEVLIIEALKAAVTAGLSSDDILAISIANGIAPAIVAANLEGAQTAGGGAFDAAPGSPGFGGGSGGDAGTISSN